MVVDILSLVFSTCVLNQSCGHWLLSDALNVFISMVFEFQANITIHAIPKNMVDDDMGGYDVGKIGCEYQKKVISVLNLFSFLQKFDFKKCIILVFYVGSMVQELAPCVFIHWLWRVCIMVVIKYNQRSLISMLLKYYEHLHPLTLTSQIDSQSSHIDINVGCVLNISEMSSCSNEPMKECVIWGFMLFIRFQVDAKEIKCLV